MEALLEGLQAIQADHGVIKRDMNKIGKLFEYSLGPSCYSPLLADTENISLREKTKEIRQKNTTLTEELTGLRRLLYRCSLCNWLDFETIRFSTYDSPHSERPTMLGPS